MPDAAAPFAGSHRAYDSIVRPNVPIAMRDGVVLAADIYLPAHSGKAMDGAFPAIVERTPYLKDGTRYARRGHWYARCGYATVINDVRGRGSSTGDWYPFALEAPDGYDVVEWVAAQPWCNGLVGTMGASYAGSDQSALATLNPPHLACQVVGQGTSNYHVSSLRQGGALEQRFIRYAFRMARSSREALADPDLKRALDAADRHIPELFGPPLRFRPGRTALRLLPTYEQWAWDILTRGVYDEYWMQRGYTIDKYWDEHADVPVLFQSGWYDTYPRGAIANFVALCERKSSPMRLVLGPWRHGEGTVEESTAGDVELGIDAAVPAYDDMRLRFFDEHLKGLDTGLRTAPPVRYFVMGSQQGRPPADLEHTLWHGGRWEDAAAWPPPEYQEVALYFHHDGSMQAQPPSSPHEPTRYTYDPRDPVPTAGGSISASEDLLPSGGFDQRGQPGRFFGHRDTLSLASRPDVLSFRDAAAGRRRRDRRCSRGAAVRGEQRGRHRLHRQAARRISPRPRCARQHARWLPIESVRQHHPRALPQWLRRRGAAHARRGQRVPHHLVSDGQPLRARAPDSNRYLVIQLPTFRCQSQYRRTPRARPPRRHGRSVDLPRCQPAEPTTRARTRRLSQRADGQSRRLKREANDWCDHDFSCSR